MDAQVILIGTGSEVQLAVEAREALQAEGIATRVVSMPCVEWFNKQDAAYREAVLPAVGQGPRLGGSRNRPGLEGIRRRRRPLRLARALRRIRRLQAPVPGIRHHRRSSRRRRQGIRSPDSSPDSTSHEFKEIRNDMSTPTQQLSDAGVSIWLDDLSREPPEDRHAAEADRRKERGGCHHEPDASSTPPSPPARTTTPPSRPRPLPAPPSRRPSSRSRRRRRRRLRPFAPVCRGNQRR